MSENKKPFHNPFSNLAALREKLPAASQAPSPSLAKAPPKAVVRMERAGRRGKEVTVIEQLDLSSSEREAWLTKLKSALGCGGSIEADGALVLQGDHRERVAAWLKERGVKRVSVG